MFEQLNRGEDVTKGLRKVDKSEMTHKNPALRASNTVPATSSSASGGLSVDSIHDGTDAAAAPKKPIKPSKPQALAGKKPAKFALEGNKWMIVSVPHKLSSRQLQTMLVNRSTKRTSLH